MKLNRLFLTLILAFSLTNYVSAQEFHLHPIDTSLVKSIYNADTSYSELGYIYLSTNYKAISDKDSVLYISDYDSIYCSFTQKFEHNINYKVKQSNCTEPKGKEVWIEFPKIEKKNLANFVEQLESINFNWNKWNSDYTKYEPKGVGCYYSIKQTKNKSIIYFFCGC